MQHSNTRSKILRRDSAMPHLIKNHAPGTSMRSHAQVAGGDGQSFNLRLDQVLNVHQTLTDVVLNPQTAVSTSLLETVGGTVSFKINPVDIIARECFLEIDYTNTDTGNQTVAPGPLWLSYLRFISGSGHQLQEMQGEEIYHDIITGNEYNNYSTLATPLIMSATTYGTSGNIATTATGTAIIPLTGSFISQCKPFLGGISNNGIEVRVIFRGSDMLVTTGNNDGIMRCDNIRFRIRGEQIPEDEAETLRREYRHKKHDFKFLNYHRQQFSQTFVSGTRYSLKLNSLNGLAPYMFFTVRATLTAAGLYTYTAITDCELFDNQNRSLFGGQTMKSTYLRNILGPMHFPNGNAFATLPLYAVSFVDSPSELLQQPSNVGYELFHDNSLALLAASSATYSIDVYIRAYSLFSIMPDGSMKVFDS